MGIVPAQLELIQRAAPSARPRHVAPEEHRLPALDGVRGFAILLVMVYHFQIPMLYATAELPFATFARSGWVGVDLFFVLSGFLITRILLQAKGSSHYFRNFYARRVLRIFPLYYAFVAVLMFFVPVIGGKTSRIAAAALRDHQWWMWAHASNWLIAWKDNFHSPTTLGTGGCWSLAIEEQYYLLWPLIVLLVSRRKLLWVCLSMAVASIAVRFAMAYTGFSWSAVYAVTFSRLDPIALGGALAVVSSSPHVMQRLRRIAPWAAVVAALAFFVVEATRDYIPRDLTRMLALEITLLSVLWPATLVIALTAGAGSIARAVTTHAIPRTFGKYSYAIYLFHPDIAHLMRMNGRIYKHVFTVFGSVIPFQLAFMTVAALVSLGAGMLSWHLFEKHFLKLKRLFPRRGSA